MRSESGIALALGVLVATAAAGCASSGRSTFEIGVPPVSLRDPDPTPARIAARIRVIGQVFDEAGELVPNARVHAQVHPRPRCIGGRGAWGETASRDDGWFIKTLYFHTLVRTSSCVRVIARPPLGEPLRPDTVELSASFQTLGAVDTALVALVLRGR